MKPLIGCTTYHKNLVQTPPIEVYGLMPSYARAIVAGGGIPILIPLNLNEQDLAELVGRLDGVLLPGGGDIGASCYRAEHHETMRDIDPERDRVELFVAQQAIAMGKPLLAICRGFQMLNVARGGSLWQDVQSQKSGAIRHDYFIGHERSHQPHTVRVTEGTHLGRLLGREESLVNSLHHQGVRELGKGLVVAAVAPDGLIEGIELPDHRFAVGVQWHPENLIEKDEAMLQLFQGFIRAAEGDE